MKKLITSIAFILGLSLLFMAILIILPSPLLSADQDPLISLEVIGKQTEYLSGEPITFII